MPIHNMVAHLRERLSSLRARIRECAGLESPPRSWRRSDPFRNMKTYIPADERAVIFDVGANTGQSIRSFRAAFPCATIHSFEPSPEVFARELLPRFGKCAGVHLWNMAVGASEGMMTLHENSASVMTSFLAPGKAGWGALMRTTTVPVTTLDAFAARNNLGFIHILKSDTQGFDLEVLKGAERLLSEGRVGMIHVEITLVELYEGLPSFDVMYRHLADRGFSLAGFYKMRVHDGLLGWMDALFIRNSFHAERHRDAPGRIEPLS
jgi:FkbM family methyltransferase